MTPNYLNFCVGQIPCTYNLQKNIQTIKNLIDTAYDHKHNSIPLTKEGVYSPSPELVHEYVVTPESALTGLIPDFIDRHGLENIKDAEQEIFDYAKEKQIGLFLGTLGIDDFNWKRNIIKVKDTKGNSLKDVYKTYTTDFEGCLSSKITTIESDGKTDEKTYIENIKQNNIIEIPEIPKVHMEGNLDAFSVAVWICNDLWGNVFESSIDDIRPTLPRLAQLTNNINAHIHCSNAVRGNFIAIDDINWDWHLGFLRSLSYTLDGIPIVHVDNSCQMDGTPYDGKTASPSGVYEWGERVRIVPDHGETHFHYGFGFRK